MPEDRQADEYGFTIYVNGEEQYFFWDWNRED